MINIERLKIKAKMFRGFADPSRLAIMECLRAGEKTVTDIIEETAQNQSNISNHLSCLLGCGLVQNRRCGKNVFYSIRNEKIEELLATSDKLLAEVSKEVFECTREVG